MTYPIELDIDRIKKEYKWSDYSQQAKDDIETLIDQLEHYESVRNPVTIDDLEREIGELENDVWELEEAAQNLKEKVDTQKENITSLLKYIESNSISKPTHIIAIAANYGFNWE